ncbi:MAG: biotin--[acetyl-CoA-carboxylase] ligase, partial [Saprospiraceae bacterium]|nr:biotin--[acetyl-CoA-carboxylase] ligase [Saprospiraceae bacterium]
FVTNTLFVGKVYHRFAELASTNDYAANLLAMDTTSPETAKSRPPEGTVVWADSQSAGRGQFGSRWESAAGQNLTLSIILYPDWLEIKDQFYLSMTIALALIDTAKQQSGVPTAIPITAKWPNDLYLGNNKSGGILIQNSLSGNSWISAIIGIGLNVNQSSFPDMQAQPTSLALAAGQTFDLDAVAETLFECVERRYLQLKAGHRAEIQQEYENCLFRRGIPSDFQRPDGEIFQGMITGVHSDGRICIETTQGKELFGLKEVAFLTPSLTLPLKGKGT